MDDVLQSFIINKFVCNEVSQMGALAEKELKPKHKRTMGVNTAGQAIEDPEEFCLAFGESQEDYNKVMEMYG